MTMIKRNVSLINVVIYWALNAEKSRVLYYFCVWAQTHWSWLFRVTCPGTHLGKKPVKLPRMHRHTRDLKQLSTLLSLYWMRTIVDKTQNTRMYTQRGEKTKHIYFTSTLIISFCHLWIHHFLFYYFIYLISVVPLHISILKLRQKSYWMIFCAYIILKIFFSY